MDVPVAKSNLQAVGNGHHQSEPRMDMRKDWHATKCFNIRAGLMTKAGGPFIQMINSRKVLK